MDTLNRETATPQEHYQYLVRLGFSEAEAKIISGLIPGEWVRASEVKADPFTPEELAAYLDLSAFEFEGGVNYLVEELELPESVARQMMAAAKGELESFAQRDEPTKPAL